MNILIITFRIPFPPAKGDTLKIFNLAKRLAVNNKVTILTYYENESELQNIKEIEKYNISVHVVKFSKLKAFSNLVFGLFSSRPFQISYYYNSNYAKKLNEIFNTEKIDVAYFHLVRAAQYIDEVENNYSVNVVDFTDALSLFYGRFYKVEKNPVKKIFGKIEHERLVKYEAIARKFSQLYICSHKDKSYIEGNYKDLVPKLLENGIDTDYFYPENVSIDKNKILLTGFMSAVQNVDAAIYFAESIFPIVLKAIPEAKFYIVGKSPSKKVLNLQSDNIIVTGYIEDIKKEYLSASVNVAPVRYGSGTQNKILESLALGVPVVANSSSLKGMNEDLKEIIFGANNAEEFAEKVIHIMKNPSLRAEVSAKGVTLIKEKYSWNEVINKFESELKELHLKQKRN